MSQSPLARSPEVRGGSALCMPNILCFKVRTHLKKIPYLTALLQVLYGVTYPDFISICLLLCLMLFFFCCCCATRNVAREQ